MSQVTWRNTSRQTEVPSRQYAIALNTQNMGVGACMSDPHKVVVSPVGLEPTTR